MKTVPELRELYENFPSHSFRRSDKNSDSIASIFNSILNGDLDFPMKKHLIIPKGRHTISY